MALKNKKSKTTIDDLAKAIDNLAAMTKREFDKVGGKFDETEGRFDEMEGRFNKMEGKLDNLIETNAQEHEEIKLRLDNVAYRFELVELQKRVEVLEEKVV